MSKARGPYRVDPLGYKKANEALDKMAENARELGLDYELQDKDPDLIEQPAQQEPYGWVRMNANFNSGVFHLGSKCPPGWVGGARAVYSEQPAQRTWVGLSHEEIDYQAKKDDHAIYFALGALWAEAKLKEKNT